MLVSYNMASESKKRKPNWTDEEMTILTSSVVENRDVLFAKYSSSITNKKKRKAIWKEALERMAAALEKIIKKW